VTESQSFWKKKRSHPTSTVAKGEGSKKYNVTIGIGR
jgi:hypothetical protein